MKKILRKMFNRRKEKIHQSNNETESEWGPEINIEFIGSTKPELKIGCGTYCNGLKIYCWDARINIDIGKFCSIADNVIITAGGEHEKEWVSSYPFVKKFNLTDLYTKQKVRFKGNIRIGNDVWIGNNVSILSGINIGDGAVIGANSNVVKDVAPYGIAVGNPAKVIKLRFSENDIKKLLELKWWDWPLERILHNVQYFDNIELFLRKNYEK